MNFYRPQKRKRAKMGVRESRVIKCAGHLKWVRGHECVVANRNEIRTTGIEPHVCNGRMEAHHSITRGAGGGDDTAVPLCSLAHSLVHTLGSMTFEARFRVDLTDIAATLWETSPHGKKYRFQKPP